jgi:hypothetical protein
MRAKCSESIPRYTRAECVVVSASPDWVASAALQERQSQGGRRIRIRKARAQSKIGRKYAYKCCSHELELLHVRFRERSESVDFCLLDSGRVGLADSSQRLGVRLGVSNSSQGFRGVEVRPGF